MKNYLTRYHVAIGLVATVISLGVAIMYLFVVPIEVSGASEVQKIVLMYGHSLCWFLLSGAGLIWALRGTNRWSTVLLCLGLMVYAVFLITLVSLG
ncbi:MAG: hypothetical protein UY35_C0003G0057 [Candidatus Saccharibacteria bacterium GW2011_GWC2_48_9]|nr:MAG: hypothetical protein UY35_C0003G0057 [Candidatus Saccharibacteria bacterium GW2011_GWC2_48_9]HCH34114.1 hypothetical protein [Candidatus Saccharibacteria bacterium]